MNNDNKKTESPVVEPETSKSISPETTNIDIENETTLSKTLDYKDILDISSKKLSNIEGKSLDLITVSEPVDIEMAIQFSKIISKLSPLIGNLIEFSTVDILNEQDWDDLGYWERQDPGFPDATFVSDEIVPNPGIEIKTWFPLATEITARFKDSVKYFVDDQIQVALLAWLPEFVFWGKPQIIDICIISADSLAKARDLHYSNPPHYLVIEPQDTSLRTKNLQQTNTNGYVIQSAEEFKKAQNYLEENKVDLSSYSTDPKYQKQLQNLVSKFEYRNDTNYAKLDRINHDEIKSFKESVLDKEFKGLTIRKWATLANRKDSTELSKQIQLNLLK